jgi:hypothetical protein
VSTRKTWRSAAHRLRNLRVTGYGLSQKVRHLREQEKELDDVTLAHKIETVSATPTCRKGKST